MGKKLGGKIGSAVENYGLGYRPPEGGRLNIAEKKKQGRSRRGGLRGGGDGGKDLQRGRSCLRSGGRLGVENGFEWQKILLSRALGGG